MPTIDPSAPLLITGGSGFVGSHLYELLISQNFTNLHITNYSPLSETEAAFFKQATAHEINLTDFEATKDLIAKIKPVGIYHLASLAAVGSSYDDRQKIFANNTKLHENILESVKQVSPGTRIIAIGSAEVYGKSLADSELPVTEEHTFRPINPYAVSKIFQDSLSYMYYLAHGLDIVRVRPFNHIGERQTAQFAVATFAEQVALVEQGKQATIKVGNLDAVRDFTDVKDVVAAYVLLMEQGETGEVYNVASGTGITMKEVLQQLISLSATTVTIETDESRLRPSDIPVMIGDASKIKQLGWEATIPLPETLTRILDYWRKTI